MSALNTDQPYLSQSQIPWSGWMLLLLIGIAVRATEFELQIVIAKCTEI